MIASFHAQVGEEPVERFAGEYAETVSSQNNPQNIHTSPITIPKLCPSPPPPIQPAFRPPFEHAAAAGRERRRWPKQTKIGKGCRLIAYKSSYARVVG
eukprot:7535315-Pyramimonas_sp.AAC.2